MTEEILINGEIMDLDASFKGVQMVFQSPYLTDFQSIVSNRTNSVTFPATNHNRAIIGCVSLQQDSVFPYRKHRAIYRRDGVQMFDGKATLLSVTDRNIQMCFTWGNTDAFQKLFDTNLRELDLGRCNYPPALSNTANYIPLIDYGGGRMGVGVSVSSVLTAIQTKCGVTGLTSLASFVSNRRYALALTTRNGDTTTREKQGLQFGTLGAKSFSSGSFYGWSALLNASGGTDPKHIMDSDGVIDISEMQSLHIKLKGTFRMTKRVSTDFNHDMRLVCYTPDAGSSSRTLCTGTQISYQSSTKVIEYSPDIDADFDISGYQYAFIALFQDTLGGSGFEPTLSDISMTAKSIVPDSAESEEVMYGSGISNVYPVGLNLPDMTCAQFIKNLLWLHGLFAFSLDGRTFEFASFAALDENKDIALDWTDKMVTLQPKERQTKLDTARKNYFRYKEADWYDNAQYQGVLTTDDETIDAEKDYCKSDFALIPDNKIPAWSVNEDGEWDFAGDNLPPVLVSAYVVVDSVVMLTSCYNSAQRWNNLLSRHYQQYAAMIQHPVVIKADFLVTTADLNQLDMRIPVYLKQTGRYYAIRKLTTKNAKVAEAELIELK